MYESNGEDVLVRVLILRVLAVRKLGEVDVDAFLAIARSADDCREEADALHVITGLLGCLAARTRASSP